MTRTATKILTTLTLATVLAVGTPLAANAATYRVNYLPSLAACKAESAKAAYNNSFARVSRACWKTDFEGWVFQYTTR